MIDYTDWDARNRRLDHLLGAVPKIINTAIEKHIIDDGNWDAGRELAAVVTLFSGGNDSIVLSDIMQRLGLTDYFGHANTGIGIEGTREFVRKTCAEWGIPLLERAPKPGRTYEEDVMTHGFPGPGRHGEIFNRIKGSGLEQINAELVGNPYRNRVLYVAGRRFQESQRRKARKIPVWERSTSIKSMVWVSPLRGWTKLDLNTYRTRFPDCPRNPIADDLGMSGECECGAYATEGELDTLRNYPPAADVVRQIEELQEKVIAAGVVPARRCVWGWGASRDLCNQGCNL